MDQMVTFLLRGLVYASACVGAGYFGWAVYEGGWSRPFVIIAVVGGAVGVAAAFLTSQRRAL
jgi:hypothetical protein